MRKETWYMPPEIESSEIITEGVLCSSGGNEVVGEEEGNGEFN